MLQVEHINNWALKQILVCTCPRLRTLNLAIYKPIPIKEKRWLQKKDKVLMTCQC